MIIRLLKRVFKNERARGNVLVTGVIVMTLLSVLGVVLVSRMIIDSHASANRAIGTRAFYLADGGLQFARRRLMLFPINMADWDTTLSIGNGTIDVSVRQDRIRYPTFWNRPYVYRITSTATIGDATRQVEEIRRRKRDAADPTTNGEFLIWRETVINEEF